MHISNSYSVPNDNSVQRHKRNQNLFRLDEILMENERHRLVFTQFITLKLMVCLLGRLGKHREPIACKSILCGSLEVCARTIAEVGGGLYHKVG